MSSFCYPEVMLFVLSAIPTSCLCVVTCFTQGRGTAIVVVFGGDPHVLSATPTSLFQVLYCFMQGRGAAVVAVSGGNPYMRSDGAGETGGEEMRGAADAGTQTIP